MKRIISTIFSMLAVAGLPTYAMACTPAGCAPPDWSLAHNMVEVRSIAEIDPASTFDQLKHRIDNKKYRLPNRRYTLEVIDPLLSGYSMGTQFTVDGSYSLFDVHSLCGDPSVKSYPVGQRYVINVPANYVPAQGGINFMPANLLLHCSYVVGYMVAEIKTFRALRASFNASIGTTNWPPSKILQLYELAQKLHDFHTIQAIESRLSAKLAQHEDFIARKAAREWAGGNRQAAMNMLAAYDFTKPRSQDMRAIRTYFALNSSPPMPGRDWISGKKPVFDGNLWLTYFPNHVNATPLRKSWLPPGSAIYQTMDLSGLNLVGAEFRYIRFGVLDLSNSRGYAMTSHESWADTLDVRSALIDMPASGNSLMSHEILFDCNTLGNIHYYSYMSSLSRGPNKLICHKPLPHEIPKLLTLPWLIDKQNAKP